MKIQEAVKNNFIISTDKRKLNLHFIHNYLCNESYWAKNISLDVVKKSIDGSCCFGLYKITNKENNAIAQIGFARVVTDYATFAYLADVFIISSIIHLAKAFPLHSSIIKTSAR